MKHAGPQALDALEDLLVVLRAQPGLREKTRGAFYRGSVAFLHFHEDAAGLFADVKIDGEFQRLPVNSAAERRCLRALVAAAVAAGRRS